MADEKPDGTIEMQLYVDFHITRLGQGVITVGAEPCSGLVHMELNPRVEGAGQDVCLSPLAANTLASMLLTAAANQLPPEDQGGWGQ